MTEYKVFIPSAGLGTRLGDLSKNRNKALVTVGTKPAICHIIDKFPKDIEFVVALGHMGDLTKQFLSLAYPDRKITCVDIQKYDGPGSGLGRTVLDCQEHLQCPFVFCSNDTIVREEIPPPTMNWLGYDYVDDVSKYRTISTYNGCVVGINEKAERVWEHEKDVYPYIGLAGVKDYELFWKMMNEGVNDGSIEVGESYGLRWLVGDKMDLKKFTWLDTGNKASLEKAIAELTPAESPNILPKANEDIWFVNNRVVKYSTDKSFISKRVQRADQLEGFVPKIESSTENMYSYQMVTGKTMSSVFTEPVFSDFLVFLDGFWKPFEADNLKQLCHEFYKEKTFSRVSQYFNRFSYEDREETVNGIKLPKLSKLLDSLDWERVCDGTPVRNHGDLHFENVLISEDYHFVLLDWRQDFAGEMRYGDIYYDLAKILHGIIVSHGVVSQDLFSVEADGDIIKYELVRKHSLVKAQVLFEKYVVKEGYDWWKVRALTALIYLNIAPLHHYPYSELLFYLGKDMLAEVTNGTN